MSSHYATGDIWIGNLDGPDEIATVAEIVEGALRSAGYKVSVTLTDHPYDNDKKED
ncbi:hypothetical protein [Streptomyces sp. NPDC056169]|uniref:hypothetical protein n=1 Tax=Streptomyces sp. NPDC056169 TaxID=3345734 RepID=UPI0035E093D6